ncbi:glutathione S-transferase family protein [Kordiimonas sp. SCSIO 12610]|uniref:glutathione S-transferase family protein n=1 Tax=Kordiimonas sp. SCSIO 12610 TaxID=2829597 RepID=UPI00210D1CF8|nr:glutathione S-transferase family protein [Kordiimonas sp. SCSIO 12610]UTW54480.1 glutathione S-transferase family protein [Kordiimonas sp. SCSIO 12610]
MQLFGLNLSPFYERVVIGLELKGASDKVEFGGLPHAFGTPEIMAASPTGKIPYFVTDSGDVLIEGQVILEYVDGVLDGPDLLPEDSDAAANAKLLARIYDMYVIPALGPVLMALIFQKRNDEAIENAMKEALPKALDLLNTCMSKVGTRAVGDDWTIADAALIPMVFQLDVFARQFGYTGFGDRANINAWWDSIKDTDTVKNSHERMMTVLKKMQANAG